LTKEKNVDLQIMKKKFLQCSFNVHNKKITVKFTVTCWQQLASKLLYFILQDAM